MVVIVWIYNYLCYQCLSPISCEFKSHSWRGVLYTTFCDKLSVICGMSMMFSKYSFPPRIKLKANYNWNIVESGAKHHSPKPFKNLCCCQCSCKQTPYKNNNIWIYVLVFCFSKHFTIRHNKILYYWFA